MAELIANEVLRLDMVPEPDADWGAIAVFALTFDGFEHWGSFGACAQVANSPFGEGEDLTRLRTRLFFEQQRWRHFGRDPEGGSVSYIRRLVEEIRARVGPARTRPNR